MKERKRVAAERALLDAAEQELAAQGLAGTSMQAIAARASVSVGTLYNYFADKETLLEALLADRRRSMELVTDRVLNESADKPAIDQLRALTHAVFAFFEEHRAFLQIVAAGDPSTVPKKRNATLILQKRIEVIIARGVADGTLKKSTQHIATAAFAGILKSILLSSANDKRSYVAVVDEVLDLFLRGVAV